MVNEMLKLGFIPGLLYRALSDRLIDCGLTLQSNYGFKLYGSLAKSRHTAPTVYRHSLLRVTVQAMFTLPTLLACLAGD